MNKELEDQLKEILEDLFIADTNAFESAMDKDEWSASTTVNLWEGGRTEAIQEALSRLNKVFEDRMLKIIGPDEYPANDAQNVNHLRTPENKARDSLRKELRAKTKENI